MTQVRDDLIKLRARALWKKFKGNTLRPGNPEDDIILKEYVEFMRGVPTQDIDRTFDEASKSDRMPKAHEVKRFAPGRKQNEGGSPIKASPFSVEFNDWILSVALTANNTFAETGDKDYSTIYTLAVNAEDKQAGFVQYCSGQPTEACKQLFREWVSERHVPLEKLTEVSQWPN